MEVGPDDEQLRLRVVDDVGDPGGGEAEVHRNQDDVGLGAALVQLEEQVGVLRQQRHPDRKSVVWGKSVAVRFELGGLRIIKKKKIKRQTAPLTIYRITH